MNKLTEIREEQGLTQREVAEKTHTCQSLICMIERGKIYAWPAVKKRLTRVLGVSANELFPKEEE